MTFSSLKPFPRILIRNQFAASSGYVICRSACYDSKRLKKKQRLNALHLDTYFEQTLVSPVNFRLVEQQNMNNAMNCGV
jgi:hypothetical protein